MKNLPIILFFSLFHIVAFGQNIMNSAFDTNGPMGEVLFQQNENREIVYTGIIETPYSADTIMGLAREYLYTIEKKYKAKTTGHFDGVTKVACDVELPVGVRVLSVGVMGSDDNVGKWTKPASTVNFNLVIDIRPGKYRYTLTNFVTDRWRISGEGKDNGPSNMIHWQRVNSLQKELERAKNKNKEELSAMIEMEKASYQDEYDAVIKFIEGLKTFAYISDDF